MNFEFKSTLHNINSITKRVNTSSSHWILLLNVSTAVVVGSLYLNNNLLPATYGSKENASQWINFLHSAALLWISSTIFSVLDIFFQHPFIIKFWNRCNAGYAMWISHYKLATIILIGAICSAALFIPRSQQIHTERAIEAITT